MESFRDSYSNPRGRSFAQYLSTSRKEAEEKTDWEGSQNTKVRSLIQKLQAVGCPYLEGMEDSVVSEVIFTPGEARMRLLTWLTARIHPTFQALLMSDTSTISTAPRLASLLHDVGLCSGDDHELVMGTTASSKQLHFLDALMDLVHMALGDNAERDNLQSVPWQMERCCQFLDDICQHEDLGMVFPSSVSLVPPGINVATGGRGVVLGGRGVAPGSAGDESQHNLVKVPPPSLSELATRCEQLRLLLEERQLQLESLMETHTYAELEPEAMGSCHKMLAVNLGTLAQLTASFSHMYQEEMQPWCGREAPPLTPLGPTCKRVDMLKAELDKVFQALGSLRQSFKNLEAKSLLVKHLDDDICSSAHQTLQDCLAVLTLMST